MTTKNGMPRREVLRMGAAGAAAAWAATRSKLGLAAGKVPIGVQLYSVRKDCERDLPGTLKALKGYGYEAVEFAGYYGRTAADMRKLLDDNGLKCCGTHTALDTLEGDALAKTIDYNKTIGNKFLIVPWIPEERRKTAGRLEEARRAVRRARGQGRPGGDARRLPQPQRRVHPARGNDALGPLLRRDEEVGHPAGGHRQLPRRRRRPGGPHQAVPGPDGHHPHQGVLEDEAGRLRRRGRRALEGGLRGLRDRGRDRVVHRGVRAREPARAARRRPAA